MRAAHGVVEQFPQPALDLLGYHVFPPAGLDVDLFPGQADHTDQQALGQPVLAHHLGREPAARLGQHQLAVTFEPQQAIALHACHGLADGRPALAQPLRDPGPEWDDALFLQLEDGPQIHLRGIDQPVRGHRYSFRSRCYAVRHAGAYR